MSPESERIKILLVEDDAGDVRLLREAMKDAGPWCDLTVATNGAQALDMLFRRGIYSRFELPAIVLLDIRLPILSGHEVLHAIKSNSRLSPLPVIILSTSQAPEDVRRAYALGASCYIVKPPDLEQFVAICNSLHDFWTKRVTLPVADAAAS